MRILSILIFTGLLMISCEKNVTDKYAHTVQNLFILSGQLSAHENPMVNLTRSISMVELDSLYYLNNAQVQLLSGENTYLMDPIGNGFYQTEEVILLPGQEIEIICSGEELPTASASVVIPEDPVISDFEYSVDEEYVFHMDLVIEDPGVSEDYYSFYVSGWRTWVKRHHDFETGENTYDTVTVFVNYNFGTQDSVIEYSGGPNQFRERNDYYGSIGGSMLHFSDRYFDGGTYHLSLSETSLQYLYNDSIPEITVHLVKRDKHYFEFIESMIRYDPYNDLPVVQPIQIYSNIEGGFGLLTGNSIFSQTIDMSEWYYDPAFLDSLQYK